VLEKLKQVLGIEGVKLELITPIEASKSAGSIHGLIRLTTIRDCEIEKIQVSLVEKYTRGKKSNLKIDEYVMGRLELNSRKSITKDNPIEIPFELNFTFVASEMDELEKSNFLVGNIVKLAKKLKGVKSEFTIRAQADVKNTKLSPFDIKEIKMK